MTMRVMYFRDDELLAATILDWSSPGILSPSVELTRWLRTLDFRLKEGDLIQYHIGTAS